MSIDCDACPMWGMRSVEKRVDGFRIWTAASVNHRRKARVRVYMAQGLFEDPHHERADLATVSSHIRRGFDVPEPIRKLAIQKCMAILLQGGSDRATMAAVRCIIAAEKVNVEIAKAIPNVNVNVNVGVTQAQKPTVDLETALRKLSIADRRKVLEAQRILDAAAEEVSSS